jgi:hypothetical protein
MMRGMPVPECRASAARAAASAPPPRAPPPPLPRPAPPPSAATSPSAPGRAGSASAPASAPAPGPGTAPCAATARPPTCATKSPDPCCAPSARSVPPPAPLVAGLVGPPTSASALPPSLAGRSPCPGSLSEPFGWSVLLATADAPPGVPCPASPLLTPLPAPLGAEPGATSARPNRSGLATSATAEGRGRPAPLTSSASAVADNSSTTHASSGARRLLPAARPQPCQRPERRGEGEARVTKWVARARGGKGHQGGVPWYGEGQVRELGCRARCAVAVLSGTALLAAQDLSCEC